MKGKGPALRSQATRIACATALFVACAVLCIPGWAGTTKHSKKKAPTASPTKGTTKNISTKGTVTTSTNTPKRPAASAKTSTRGKSRRASTTSRRSSRREKGQKTPTADRISEIQQALAKDGAYNGEPNGKWDSSTVDAVRKFQAAHGLNA